MTHECLFHGFCGNFEAKKGKLKTFLITLVKKTSREYDLIVIKSACQVSSMSVLWFLLSDLFIYFEFKNLGDNKQKTLVFSE